MIVLQLCTAPELEQTLALTGGAAQTIFPQVEAWLAQDGDHWQAFTAIRGRKSMARYRSVVDFLVGEAVPVLRPACFAFYRGQGPALRDLLTPRQVARVEAQLLAFLAVAYEAFAQKRALSWRTVVDLVDDALRAA